ncbi:type I-E CRISPR-associated protein Cas5/CasD [soil metagenome]|nr:type I-E CRISPR-associated protein Cas5/CasD [Gemmatimonadota bacterium]
MRTFLLLRLEGPLQAWGDVALDPRRPTRAFPSCSGLAGLLANALGWQHREGERTTLLQDALRYAVREDRQPHPIWDYQTADLSERGHAGVEGWTRWGIEHRGTSEAARGTQVLHKQYLADASFLVALTLTEAAPATIDALQEALRRPARPLFLGRKGCPPALPLLEHPRCLVRAENGYAALESAPLPERLRRRSHPQRSMSRDAGENGDTVWLPCWYSPGDGPPHRPAQLQEIWDRRDFAANRFAGSRRIVEGRVNPPVGFADNPADAS